MFPTILYYSFICKYTCLVDFYMCAIYFVEQTDITSKHLSILGVLAKLASKTAMWLKRFKNHYFKELVT